MTPFNRAELTVQVKWWKSCTMLLQRPLLFLLFSPYVRAENRETLLLSQAVNMWRCLQATVFQQLRAVQCSAVHFTGCSTVGKTDMKKLNLKHFHENSKSDKNLWLFESSWLIQNKQFQCLDAFFNLKTVQQLCQCHRGSLNFKRLSGISDYKVEFHRWGQQEATVGAKCRKLWCCVTKHAPEEKKKQQQQQQHYQQHNHTLFFKKYSAYQTHCTNQCRRNHTIMELCQGLQIIQCIKYFFLIYCNIFPLCSMLESNIGLFFPLTLQQLWCHYG